MALSTAIMRYAVVLVCQLWCWQAVRAQIITVPPPSPKPTLPAFEQAAWSITLGAGWSRRIAALPDGLSKDQQAFIEGQRNGAHIALGVEHFRRNTFGYGLNAEAVRWSHSVDALTLEDTGLVAERAPASSTVRLLAIGPRVYWRPVDPKGNLAFTVEFGGGYINYHDAFAFGNTDYAIIGHSFFGNGALLLDVKTGQRFTVGARLAYVLAAFNRFEVKLDDGTVRALPFSYTEDVKRLDAGLRLAIAIGR